MVPEGFTGVIEDFAAPTRTSLADGNYIAWSQNDRIAVFQGSSAPDCFRVSDASVGNTKASFVAVSLEGSTEDNLISFYQENLAMYPYDGKAYCKALYTDSDRVTVYEIGGIPYPEEQTYVDKSFPSDALVMVAVTGSLSDRNLRFKAAGSVLRFKVRGSTVLKSIKVEGNGGELLSGKGRVEIDLVNGGIAAEVYNGSSSVILDCGSGVSLDGSDAKVFMLCIPPTEFESGFKVTFTDINGEEDVRTVSKSVNARRGHIFGMSEITFGEPSESTDEYDYIDENGINQGSGVEIDGVVWAPVNCGYHESDYPWGKLYQWGRKYGQGYTTSYDASAPDLMPGPVSLSVGESDYNGRYFFSIESSRNWLANQIDWLWNIGSEDSPVKTEYDPCPEGWRVPTSIELSELAQNNAPMKTENGQRGRWFGRGTSDSRIFLPSAGFLSGRGSASYRNDEGYYWSSTPSGDLAYYLESTADEVDVKYYFLRTLGFSIRCVKDDGELIPVSSLTLSETSLSLQEDETSNLSATITPSNATHQSAFWWSENPLVATVDQNGIVTAVSVGTTTVTAMAGMQIAVCTVTVTTASDQNVYIDENGINQGSGVEIDGVVWAPVNCGYHETDFKYGKLYQWGRKYGQGYDGSLNDGNGMGAYEDASVPITKKGPESLTINRSDLYAKIFYTVDSSPYDWLSPQNDKLWNSGDEDNPVKTEYDPCPEGWRVPTYAEFEALAENKSSWATDSKGQVGYWFSGSKPYSSSVPRVFFPAAGRRDYYDGKASDRGLNGYYWSSVSDVGFSYYFYFLEYGAYLGGFNRGCGSSVRCVQDDAGLVPVTSVSLNESSLAIDEGDTFTLSVTISPSDANHQSAHWWSDDESIATVDQTGVVTAVSAGTATITAMAGMKSATCRVTVNEKVTAQEGDYVDEYGVNHGQGVEIDGVVWAPVNCGYHKTDFKYGKLYQWGRKYGQGYEGSLYDMNGNYVSAYLDASSPKIKYDSVNLIDAQSQANANNFYASNDAPYNWADALYDALWNANTEDDPLKSEYDPCPDGWRVPTHSELSQLVKNYELGKDVYFRDGYWFSGSATYSLDVPQVFLITAGQRSFNGGAMSRGYSSSYWTSGTNSNFAYTLNFDVTFVSMGYLTRASAYPVRCVQDDGELVPVTSVSLNKSSLTMNEGGTYTLSVTISPSDANHQSAHWWSDDESIATVDQTGKVRAVSAGTATITAMAGMKSATCQVTVKDQSVAQEGDYIDEYGVNHGQGVEIGGVVWAPVNCGYHKTDFKYGKLYQWGRKYGQGYDGSLYDINGNKTGTYADATVPTVTSGPVSLSTGQSESNEDFFYKNTSYPYNWLSSPDVYLWNNGTEDNPVKTEYDPCPEGWRVPTYAELDALVDNKSSWTTDSAGQIGYWFSGSESYSSSVPRVFFPATGYRDRYGDAINRGSGGYYWSSRPYDYPYRLYFLSGNVSFEYGYTYACGCSVRCVQVTD